MSRGYQNVYQLDQALPLRLLTRPASIDAIVKHQFVKFVFMTVFMTVFMRVCMTIFMKLFMTSSMTHNYLKPFFDNVFLEHGGLPHVLPLAVHLDFKVFKTESK